MQTRTLAVWMVVATVGFAPVRLPACPPIVDLWSELEQAEVVAIGRVESARPTIRALLIGTPRRLTEAGAALVEPVWDDGALVLNELAAGLPEAPQESVVVVSIEEALAGRVPPRLELTIPHWGEFRRGTKVLLFLRWRTGRLVLSRAGWGPVPLHPDTDLADLRIAVAAGVELLRDGEPSQDHVTDWLVLASALQGTRPWALPRLARGPRLEPQHAETLAAVFTSEPIAGWLLPHWFEVLADHPNTAVDRHAAAAVEVWRRDQAWPWDVAARQVLARVGIDAAVIPNPSCSQADLERLWLAVVDCALSSRERPCRPGDLIFRP